MVTQVRLFTVRPGRMDAWLAGWRRKIVPLRRRFGFEVEGGWIDRGSNRFLWILSLSPEIDWARRDAEYYDSPERREMDPDPAECLEAAEMWFVDPAPADRPSKRSEPGTRSRPRRRRTA